jgi:hypothetical protein
LDAFAVNWKDFVFPWPDEVFDRRFLREADYDATRGWSGKKWLDHFLDGCGLLTIAREPGCCDGEEKTEEIFKRVNRHIFDNGLNIVES